MLSPSSAITFLSSHRIQSLSYVTEDYNLYLLHRNRYHVYRPFLACTPTIALSAPHTQLLLQHLRGMILHLGWPANLHPTLSEPPVPFLELPLCNLTGAVPLTIWLGCGIKDLWKLESRSEHNEWCQHGNLGDHESGDAATLATPAEFQPELCLPEGWQLR